MKITTIKTHLLQKPLSATMCISRGGFKVRQHALVEVRTDEGLTGIGEGVGTALYVKALVDGRLGALAVGLDPLDIEGLRRRIMDDQVYFEQKGSVICAASAIEMACWDIKGKALGVPICELLGGKNRLSIEGYASDIYWEEDEGRMVARLERILEKGFRAAKAHIGAADPEQDQKRVRALREAAGKDVKLMIDLNAGYTYTQALKAMDLWREYDIYWLEEPLVPQQRQRMRELREKALMPIAAGENEFRIFGFKELFDDRAVDIAMPDIARTGGLLETKYIAAMADAYGVELSPHNFSSGVLLAATLHFMAATPNARLLEFDASENAVYEDLLSEQLKIENGKIAVPQGPGLGVELRPEILQKYGSYS